MCMYICKCNVRVSTHREKMRLCNLFCLHVSGFYCLMMKVMCACTQTMYCSSVKLAITTLGCTCWRRCPPPYLNCWKQSNGTSTRTSHWYVSKEFHVVHVINVTLVNVHYITYCIDLTSVCDVIWVKGSLISLVVLSQQSRFMSEWTIVSTWHCTFSCTISLASVSLFRIEIADLRKHSVVTRPFSSWEGVVWAHETTTKVDRSITNWKNTFHPVSWPMSSNFFFCEHSELQSLNKLCKTRPQACPFSRDPPPQPRTQAVH